MKKMIINADDLGYSKEVNQQIEKCVNQCVVTSSTLMANAPAFDGGVRIAKQYPQISVGVHLNIIEFSPLTNVDVFKHHHIVDEEGNFIEGAVFVEKIDDELERAIFEEWDAQITKVEAAGIIPTHIDSHEHTHTIEALQKVLCKVMDKHHITKVRRKSIPSIRLMLAERKDMGPKIVLDKSKAVQPRRRNVIYRRIHLFVVKYKNAQWNKRMRKRYSMTTDFSGFQSFYNHFSLIALKKDNAVLELMCHPGQKPFRPETELLIMDLSWVPQDYRFTNYRELQ